MHMHMHMHMCMTCACACHVQGHTLPEHEEKVGFEYSSLRPGPQITSCRMLSLCFNVASVPAKNRTARPQGGGESAGRCFSDNSLPLAPLLLLQGEHGAARHEAQDAADPLRCGALRVGGERESTAIAQLKLEGTRRPQ